MFIGGTFSVPSEEAVEAAVAVGEVLGRVTTGGRPVVKLSNWVIRHGQAFGTVEGHPKIADGHYVQTSLIVEDGSTEVAPWVITRNTFYWLVGPRSVDYVERLNDR